jgi:hypothetical protein
MLKRINLSSFILVISIFILSHLFIIDEPALLNVHPTTQFPEYTTCLISNPYVLPVSCDVLFQNNDQAEKQLYECDMVYINYGQVDNGLHGFVHYSENNSVFNTEICRLIHTSNIPPPS